MLKVAEEMEVEQAKTETEAQNGEQTETQPTEQTETQTAEQTETQTTEQTETQTVESSNSDTSLPDGTDGGGANNDQQQPMDVSYCISYRDKLVLEEQLFLCSG